MTAQIPEILLIDGAPHDMCDEPLSDYFELRGAYPDFASPHTALWRGYEGLWEIAEGRLYLIKLTAQLTDGTAFRLNDLFPGRSKRIFADWFSGTVRLPQGEALHYVHMGYESIYEQDRLLTFEKGVLVRDEVQDNREPWTKLPF